MSSELVPHVSGSVRHGDAENVAEIKAHRDSNHLGALHQISLLVVQADDVQSTLPDIARVARDLLRVQILSLSHGDQAWVIPADHNQRSLAPDDDSYGPTARTVIPGQIIEAHFSQERTVGVIADDDNDGITPPVRIPIQAHDSPFGFMLVRDDSLSRLDANTIDVLEKIGDTIAEAIERERQIAEQISSAAAMVNVRQLFDIVSHLATLTTIDAAIQPLLIDIADLLNADIVSLVIPDPIQSRLFTSNPVAEFANDDNLQRLSQAQIVQLALELGQLQIGSVDRQDHQSQVTSNAVAIPLVTRGEAAGVLVLERVNTGPFSFEEREAASVIARHLSFCMERERRVRAYSRQNLLLSLVERVTAFIARSTDAEDLLGRMAREIRRTFGYDCSIAMIAGNRLEFRAMEIGSQEQVPDWIQEGIPLESGIMGRVARTGQPAFVHNVQADPSFLDTGQETASEIAVPIRVGDDVVGVLNVESNRETPLENIDFEILLILANHIGIALTNRKLIASERESRVAIEAIQRVSTIVAETLDPDESLRRIAETLGEVMGYPIVSLAILEGEELVFKATYGFERAMAPVKMSIYRGVAGKVVRTGEPILLESVMDEPAYVRIRPDLVNEICVPIRCNGEIVGILNVEGTIDRPVTPRDLHLLTTFAEHAGVLLNNAREYAALSREATLDPMTGVPNLRFFQQELHEQIERSRWEDQPLSLAVIDLDDLKVINDTHGHLVGDQVLRELARRMLTQLRGEDLLARYAGDEFVAIFPNVGEDRALEIASHLLDVVRSEPFEVDGAVMDLSLSIGVATFPHDAMTSTDLLRAADMAMYVAKESGKNRASSARQSEHIRRRSKS